MSNSISINYFQKASEKRKAEIRTFYGDILGWRMQEVNSGMDIFSFDEKSTYGIQYVNADDEWLDDKEFTKSTWMSIKSDDRDSLISKMKEFGVTEMPEISDANNFFFQAPGGQVYVV